MSGVAGEMGGSPGAVARRVAAAALAVVVVAVAARVSVPVPGTPVPQSLQTLAVVLVGAWLGPRVGGGALVGYLVAGAAGLPVFADGAGGIEHLTGPTVGYLIGFVMGGVVMGWWVRWRPSASSGSAAFELSASYESYESSASSAFGATSGTAIRVVFVAFTGALVAHALILGLGWARLALILGSGEAFAGGVAPFIVGGVAKSAVAAGVWLVIRPWVIAPAA